MSKTSSLSGFGETVNSGVAKKASLLQASIPKERFKNGSGAWLTKQLFVENALEDKLISVYSLKGYDHVYRGSIYPSLRLLYVNSLDPTEYLFAQAHLGGWEHWKAITGQSWFLPILSDWREELETRIRAEALLKIKQIASNSSKDALQANRLLLSGGWNLREEKGSVGRPTKEKIKQEADKLFKDSQEFNEDFNRIFEKDTKRIFEEDTKRLGLN